MTRLRKTVYVVVAVITAYIFLNLGITLLSTAAQTQIHPVLLPWLALVLFAAYALASVGWAIYATNDRPEACKAPAKDIAAVRELRQRGVEVDSRVVNVFEEPGIA
ncbi:dolichol-phosphate mannosyltransferase subunit 3 [Lipomyces chichibuensis]|uniref:dolichol-phosphate mannosyltransferase subunit 3 n=1 Tax=Lipomyces chichibuensis TaxID=1546026 RepID=UPI00334344FB